MQITAQELARLSPLERLSLIELLWDSLDDSDVRVTGGQKTEIEHRLANFEEDSAHASTWEALKAELLSRTP